MLMDTDTSIVYADDRPVITTSVGTMTFTPNGLTYEVGDTLARNSITSILERLDKIEQKKITFTELSCRNCGGKIQQKYQDPIFKCPYCKTVYAIGYRQVNAS